MRFITENEQIEIISKKDCCDNSIIFKTDSISVELLTMKNLHAFKEQLFFDFLRNIFNVNIIRNTHHNKLSVYYRYIFYLMRKRNIIYYNFHLTSEYRIGPELCRMLILEFKTNE